jgi:hypothetical protein
MRGILGSWLFASALCMAGCRGLSPFDATRHDTPRPSLPRDYEFPAGQLVFSSDFDLPTSHRLVRELTLERDDICQTLGLPTSDEQITVYLFRNTDTYREYLAKKFPGMPPRRAFFVETDTRLAVYAQWSDRIAEDLRHEIAHGYLHAVVRGLPLWLDEGLAEYFEVPRGLGGRHEPHIALLADLRKHNNWRPDMDRLARLTDTAQMDQQNYAEAWAWVYFLLNSSPARRETLTGYLADLQSSRSDVEPLPARLQRLDKQPEDELVTFLAGLKPAESR